MMSRGGRQSLEVSFLELVPFFCGLNGEPKGLDVFFCGGGGGVPRKSVRPSVLPPYHVFAVGSDLHFSNISEIPTYQG